MKTRRKEERLHREIIRRALERSRSAQEEREGVLFRKDLLDALQEMTDLAPVELERIADDVTTAPVSNGEGYFSVRYQLFFTAILALAVFAIPILTIWLIRNIGG